MSNKDLFTEQQKHIAVTMLPKAMEALRQVVDTEGGCRHWDRSQQGCGCIYCEAKAVVDEYTRMAAVPPEKDPALESLIWKARKWTAEDFAREVRKDGCIANPQWKGWNASSMVAARKALRIGMVRLTGLKPTMDIRTWKFAAGEIDPDIPIVIAMLHCTSTAGKSGWIEKSFWDPTIKCPECGRQWGVKENDCPIIKDTYWGGRVEIKSLYDRYVAINYRESYELCFCPFCKKKVQVHLKG